MTPGGYVPDRGDAVWISMNPQAGHEQAGRRPALVISPLAYNRKVGLAIMCPITSQVKGYPFEVVIAAHSQTDERLISELADLTEKNRIVESEHMLGMRFIFRI